MRRCIAKNTGLNPGLPEIIESYITMARPDIIVSTKFTSDTVDPATLFDTAKLDNFTLDFEDALDALGDDGPLTNALDADPTSILSNKITWGNATNGAVLTGSGLTQIEDLDALESALENGIASGAFDTLQIISGGQTILSLQFATNALTLTSGDQTLALRGTLPTGVQDIFDFLGNMENVLEEVDLTAAANFLRDYDLEGLRLTDAGETLFDVTLDNAGLRINAAGGEFRVDGTVPANNLGTLVDLFQNLITLDDSPQGFNNLKQVNGLEITGISLRAADGTQLIRTTGPLEEVDRLFKDVIIQGTAGDDRDVYLDSFGGASRVIANLGAGNDSVEIYSNDFSDGFIDAAATVNGGAGFDTVSLLDFSSAQVVFDFINGSVSGRDQADQVQYSFDITSIEAAQITAFQRAMILGDQNANTAIAGDIFGQFEFYGGAGTDVLDLTRMISSRTNEEGLFQSDLSGFSATYHGNNAMELRHAGNLATIVLSDVEQVRVKGDGGGTVLLTLNQVLEASYSGTNFNVGTSSSDSLKGGKDADVLLGQSGGDYIYGDGIQANLTGAVAGQVFRMYQATLDRAPDVAGYEGWVTGLFEGSLSIDQMARGFVRSTEFQNTYGALDNTGFVNLLYQNVLDRAGDAGGVQGWLDAMASGTTREGVVVGFSQSAEFQRTTAVDAANFAVSQSEAVWSDEIYRVYRATLDRDPDAAGFLGWAELLRSGTGFDTMIGGFVRSQEFDYTYGSLTDSGFVEQLYRNVLDRAGDAAGVQGWLDAMASGTSRAGVVRGFSQSTEFQADTAADLKAWMHDQGAHDVIEAGNGTNTVSGGLFQDHFVFNAGTTGTTTILDFEDWDVLRLDGFGYTGASDDFARFQSHVDVRANKLVYEEQGVTVIFDGLGTLNEDQVLFIVA